MSTITLLELKLPEGDIQIGPKTFRRPANSKSASESEDETDKKQSSSAKSTLKNAGGSKLLLVFGIVVLVAIGIAATKRLSEEPDDEIAGFD